MDGPIVACHPDGRVVYRASALGGCDLALLAARLEYEAIPPPPKLQLVYDKGHDIEPLIVAELQRQGWSIVSPQREVELQVSKKLSIVGHIDGERWAYGQGYSEGIVEIKSQNEVEWRRFGAMGWEGGFFPKYKWQVSAYMLALNLPLYLVRVLRDGEGGIKGYDITVVEEPFYDLAAMRRRVLGIEALAATGVANAPCTSDYGCPYFYLHEELDRELVTDDAIQTLAREYVEAGRAEKVAKGQKDASRLALRKAISADKIATADGTKVTFYMAGNPPSLDKARLEAVLKIGGAKLEDFYTSSKSERIRVTLPAEQEDGNDGEHRGVAE